eukprot:1106413-Pleurochrysis_carterae.AAC.1
MAVKAYVCSSFAVAATGTKGRDTKGQEEEACRRAGRYEDNLRRAGTKNRGRGVGDASTKRRQGSKEVTGRTRWKRDIYRVFKDDTMDLAHQEEYTGHPILRLFMRPEETENSQYMRISRKDIRHMNGADGKKLTYKTLRVAMALHERHAFHLAVATNGAKKGGTRDRMETQRMSETTYRDGKARNRRKYSEKKEEGDGAT